MQDVPQTDRCYAPSEQPSEVGHVTRPPVYDAVNELDGEPPRYSYHGANGGPGNRHLNVDTQYHSNMSPNASVARYAGEVEGPRYTTDVSFESQLNASPYSMQDIRERLSPVSPLTHSQRITDSALYADRYVSDLHVCLPICKFYEQLLIT